VKNKLPNISSSE